MQSDRPVSICCAGLACAEKIKRHLDAKWEPHWHVIIGRNFGTFVTHETKMFIYFYLGDKAVMVYKAG
jgi:dynein light chain LC8-type